MSDGTILDAAGSLIVVKDNHLYTCAIADATLSRMNDIPVEIDGVVSFPALSPDGQYIFIPSVRSAYIVSTDGTHQIELPVNGYVRYPAWSSDSTSIAYGTWEGIQVSSISRDSVHTETILAENAVRYITWAPDQPRLAFVYTLHLFTLPVATTDSHAMLPQQATPVIQDSLAYPNLVYDWSPDGHALVGVDGRDITIAAVTGDTAARTMPIAGEYANFLQWSPDGASIAAGMQHLWIIDPTTMHTTQLTHFEDILAVRNGTWSPDGSRIAFGSQIRHHAKEDWWKIYVIDRDGSNLMQLTNDDIAAISAPLWSPDGAFILFRGGIEHGLDRFAEQGLYLAKTDGSAVTLLLSGSQWATWLPQ